MSFSAVTGRANGSATSSGTTLSVSPAANITVGKLVFVCSTTDNYVTSSGSSGEHSISDSQSNVWTKVAEYTNSDGVAADGITVSVFWSVITTQISTSDTITLTCANSVEDKLVCVLEATISVPGISVLFDVENTNTAKVTGLSLLEGYLFLGCAGGEGYDTTKSSTTDFTEVYDLATTVSGGIGSYLQYRNVGSPCLLSEYLITVAGWAPTNPIYYSIAVLNYDTTKAISAAHASAYIETEQELLEVAHVSAYLETEQKLLEVQGAFLYVETKEAYVLEIDSCYSEHYADEPSIVRVKDLLIDSAYHEHYADSFDIESGETYDLEIDSAYSAHYADTVRITGIIIDINHETNDLTQYTSTVTDGGDLSVTAAAALGGTNYGLQCVIDDTTAIYGEYNPATASTTGIWRHRFYIDPNSLTIGSGNAFIIFSTYKASGTQQTVIKLYNNGANYQVFIDVFNDAGTGIETGKVTISDAPHYIEYKLTKASSADANDGTMDWWIDGVAQTSLTGLDIYNRYGDFDSIRIGAVAELDAGTSGTLYLDELIVNDSGFRIGPTPDLEISSTYSAHYADSPDISAILDIDIDSTYHSHSADEPTLAAIYPILIEGTSHEHYVDELSLSPIKQLYIDSSFHEHVADGIAVTRISTLGIDETYHDHYADDFVIVRTGVLSIDSTYHLHYADYVDVSGIGWIDIDDAYSEHYVDEPTLIATRELYVDSTYHGHFADEIATTAIYSLSINGAFHEHYADTLAISRSVDASIDDAYHSHESSEFSLTAIRQLYADSAFHEHFADDISITAIFDLGVDNTFHEHYSDEPLVVRIVTAQPEDTYHEHYADSFSVTHTHVIGVDDTYHSHYSDTIDITSSSTLLIGNCYHEHYVDTVSLSWIAGLFVDDTYHSHVTNSLNVTRSIYDVLELSIPLTREMEFVLELTRELELALEVTRTMEFEVEL